MGYLIQRTVKDPSSPVVLKVETGTNARILTNTKHEGIKEVLQKKENCEYCFTLAHRAPIMNHTLSANMRCLSDKEVVKSIIEDTHNILTELENAIKLILEEIGKIGTKKRNKKGQVTVITPEDFIRL